MSNEQASKYKIWILAITCSILLGMTSWGIVDLITEERKARDENKQKIQTLTETAIGFISKQTVLNDVHDKTHLDIIQRVTEVEKKLSKAELELYRITGKQIMETITRSSEPTEFEKLQKKYSQKE